MNDNKDDIFWPGYVDAMSNMVLTLVFVVLVLALTLSLYSMVSAQRMAEEMLLDRIISPNSRDVENPIEPGTEVLLQSRYDEQTIVLSVLEELRTSLSLLQHSHADEIVTQQPASMELIGSTENLNREEYERQLLDTLDLAQRLNIALMTENNPAVRPISGTEGGEIQTIENQQPTTNPYFLEVSYLPSLVTVFEDQRTHFSAGAGLSLSGAAMAPVILRLDAQRGTLEVDLENNGNVFVTGSGTNSIMISGQLENVNGVLASLSYGGYHNFFGHDDLRLTSLSSSGIAIDDYIQIEVVSVNDPPIALDSVITAIEDMPYTFRQADFLYDDVEHNSLSAVIIETLPAQGRLILHENLIAEGEIISVEDIRQNNLVFVPEENATGARFTEFEFRIIDDGGTAFDGENVSPHAAVMIIDLQGIPDAPIVWMPQLITAYEDQDVFFVNNDLISVSDPDGDLAFMELSAVNGALYFGEEYNDNIVGNGTGSIRLEGSQDEINLALSGMLFRADQNFFGTAMLNFHAIDAQGARSSSSTVMTVIPVNDAPVGRESLISVIAGMPYRFRSRDFVYNDVEGHQLSAVRFESLPEVGWLTLNGDRIDVGQSVSVLDLTQGNVLYQSTRSNSEDNETSFEVTVFDDGGIDNGGVNYSEEPATIVIEIQRPLGFTTLSAPNVMGEFDSNLRQAIEQNFLPVFDPDRTSGLETRARPPLDISRSYNLSTIHEDINQAENIGTRIADFLEITPDFAVAGLENGGVFVTFVDDHAGRWQASHSPYGEWQDIDLSSENGSLAYLLDFDDRIRLLPRPNRNGTSLIVFGTWAGTNERLERLISMTSPGDDIAISAAVTVARIEILPINDAPENLVPFSQTVLRGEQLNFSANFGNSLTVNDLGDNQQPGAVDELDTTIQVNHGSLRLTTAGLFSARISGDGSDTINIRGSAHDINRALEGLIYEPVFGFVGTDELSITTNDLGNTGEGGELLATSRIEINVAQAATVSGMETESVTEIETDPPEIDTVRIEGDLSSGIVLYFPNSVVGLDVDSSLILQDLLSESSEVPSGIFELRVYSTSPNLSVERAASVTRGIAVRRALVDSGVSSDSISLTIMSNARSNEFAEVWIYKINH
jgi:hypothetical protein